MRGLLKKISAITLATLIAFDTPLCSLAYDEAQWEAEEAGGVSSYDYFGDSEGSTDPDIWGYDYDTDVSDDVISDDVISDDGISVGIDDFLIEQEADMAEEDASESEDADTSGEVEEAPDVIVEEEEAEVTDAISDNDAEMVVTGDDLGNLKAYDDDIVHLVIGQKVDLGEYLKNKVTELGYDLNQKGAKFTLEDGSVISLSAKGVVKANKKGVCRIFWSTLNSHGKLTRQAMLIDTKVHKAALFDKTKTLTYVGQTYDYNYNVQNDYDCPPVSFESANPDVCTIDPETGVITAVAKGSAKISVIWGGGTYNISKYKLTGTVKVNVPALSKTEAKVLSGAKLKLIVKNVPKGTYVYWGTKDGDDCIDINSNDLTCTVTALYPGTQYVYAEIDDHQYECKIEVPGVTVKKESFTLDPKKTATVTLKNTKYKASAFNWSSSAPTVATVSNKGKIKAVGRGSATIFAEKDGIECAVLVTVNKSKKNNKNLPVDSTEGIAKSTVPADASEDTVLGSVSNGCQLTVEAGTFEKDANISASPISTKKLTSMGAYREGVFEEIISPVTISCEGYTEGDYFGTNVALTVPMGKPGETITDPEAYVFAYYDENTKSIRYLYPDSYDLEKNEMTINLPHFSSWFGAKLTKEEEIEAFLNSYCAKRAVEEGKFSQAASELEPYIKAKAKALNLRDEAFKDLVQATINIIASEGGKALADGGYSKTGAAASSVTKAMTGIARSLTDGDELAASDGFEAMAVDALQKAWDELGYSKRAGAVFDPEIAEGFSSQAIGGTYGLYKVFKHLNENETEDAMKELGNVMMGVHPAVELGTKGTRFVATCLNVEFTYWKANEVEELYHIYKNGFDRDFFGNFVLPANEESFLTYLNCSSGFTKAKGINRFYQMDKREEMWAELKERDSKWAEYGSYDSLPVEEKSRVEAYLEKELIDYFELRRQQEGVAAQIKAKEQVIIQTMLNDNLGALKLTDENTRRFFREETEKDYNLTARLERLVKIRSHISMYIDEEALERYARDEGGYNYGDMMNHWVDCCARNQIWNHPENRQQALDEFLEYVEMANVLKPGINTKYSGLNKGVLAKSFWTEHEGTTILWMIGYFDDHIWDEDGNEDIEAEKVPFNQDVRLDISDGETLNKKISGIENMKLKEDGTFSYNADGISISGYLNTSTYIGSGTFTFTSEYAKNYGYSLDEVDGFLRKGDEFPDGWNCFRNPLSYEENLTYSGSFKILPSKSDYLQFNMTGKATMEYSGTYISEVKDYSLRFDRSKATCVPGDFYGTKTWDTYESSMRWYLVPKKKTSTGTGE